MRLLLDTQVLLWSVTGHRRLSAPMRRLIEGADVCVSAASIWEIAIKASLGRLHIDPGEVWRAIEPAGFDELPITARHAARVVALPPHHRDPFDRILVAQAEVEHLELLTVDEQLAAYGSAVRFMGSRR